MKGQTKQKLKFIAYVIATIVLLYFASMLEADRVVQLGL